MEMRPLSSRVLHGLLNGRWSVRRSVVGSPQSLTFRGTAFWQQLPQLPGVLTEALGSTPLTSAEYQETGEVAIAETHFTGSASQRYMYVVESETSRETPLKVFFSDGRPFLELNFCNVSDASITSSCLLFEAADTHQCCHDTYCAKYSVAVDRPALSSEDPFYLVRRMEVVFQVSGPKKAYTSTTVYEPVST